VLENHSEVVGHFIHCFALELSATPLTNVFRKYDQWHHKGGGRTAPGGTIQGGHPNNFLWLKLERTLDKRRGQMVVVRRRQLKR